GDVAHREEATRTAERDLGLRSPDVAFTRTARRHTVVHVVSRMATGLAWRPAPTAKVPSVTVTPSAPVLAPLSPFAQSMKDLQGNIDALNGRLDTARTQTGSARLAIRNEIRQGVDRALRNEVGPLLAEKHRALAMAQTASPQVEANILAL